MNTLSTLITIAGLAGMGFWIVRLEILLRFNRRQIVRLINHQNNLHERFGLFMLRGGQDVMKKHFEKVWAENAYLNHGACKHETCSTGPQSASFPAFSFPVGAGPMEDKDTASALPPFAQQANPGDKNTGTTQTFAE